MTSPEGSPVSESGTNRYQRWKSFAADLEVTEAREVVADVGRPGDLGFDADPEDARDPQQGGAQGRVGGQGVGRPAGGELHEDGPGVGPVSIDPGDDVVHQCGSCGV